MKFEIESHYESNGSYVLVQPLKKFGEELFIGTIIVTNKKYNYMKNDEVMYHIDDIKTLNLGSEDLHLILHYHIIIKEDHINKRELELNKKRKELATSLFLDADF